MMHTILDKLYDSFAKQNWNNVIILLSTNSSDLPAYSDELIDVFENFLFRIDYTNLIDSLDGETVVNEIIQLFLHSTSSSLYQILFPSLPYDRHVEEPTLIHKLCIENKHKALAFLLRNIDPQVAAKEVKRVAFTRLDYAEEINGQSIYHTSDAYHTPIQAAWSGMIFDTKRTSLDKKLKNVNHVNDLSEEWRDLWNTTVCLLLAFDHKPIDLDYAATSNWNILHAISRYGHRIDDAVMLLALKLHPQFAYAISSDGNLALHEAAKHQICYRSHRRHWNAPGTRDNKKTHEEECDDPPRPVINRVLGPALRLLESNTSAASIFDRDGRLPLHLALIHYERNQEEMSSMARQECNSHSIVSVHY